MLGAWPAARFNYEQCEGMHRLADEDELDAMIYILLNKLPIVNIRQPERERESELAYRVFVAPLFWFVEDCD